MSTDNVVDLVLHKHKDDGPRVQVVINIYEYPDGRLGTDAQVLERMEGLEPLAPRQLVAWIGWAVLVFGRQWRLGLARRLRSGWPRWYH